MTNRDEFKMCRRKRKYTVRDAHKVTTRMNERQTKAVHQYRCPVCGERHVGRYGRKKNRNN